ncbi:MBL fold metallo-hydrolase [Corynebacterium bovis]|uniref:MBL fold metallo-hydrolase n=1 Tax=Corynebacterium bovis TaxID=36808 RepID=UPI003CC70E77
MDSSDTAQRTDRTDAPAGGAGPVTVEDVPEFTTLSTPRQTQRVTTTVRGSGPDGPAGTVTVVKTTVGDMDNNCYLVVPGDTRRADDGVDDGAGNGTPAEALLVDAADDADHLLALARTLGVTVTDVVTTHRHTDHVRALGDVLAATGARHHAPRRDAAALPAPADETYGTDDGTPEDLRAAGASLRALGMRVVELRGHTPGGLALVLPSDPTRVFTGDSLFPGGVGNTDGGEDFTTLVDDVEQRILRVLPQNTRVHPGHGDDTTVGTELPQVDAWRSRGW